MASARVVALLLAAFALVALTFNFGGFSNQNSRVLSRRLSDDPPAEQGTTSGEPKLTRVTADYDGKGKTSVLVVKEGDFVYHYGKWDKKNGWTWVTQLVAGKDGEASKYGKSGYVPDWVLGEDVPNDSDDEDSDDKKED